MYTFCWKIQQRASGPGVRAVGGYVTIYAGIDTGSFGLWYTDFGDI